MFKNLLEFFQFSTLPKNKGSESKKLLPCQKQQLCIVPFCRISKTNTLANKQAAMKAISGRPCQTYITRNRFKSEYFLHRARHTLHGTDSNQNTSYTVPDIHYTEQIQIRILPTPCQTYITRNRFKSEYFLHRARHTLHGTDSNQNTSYTVPDIHYTEQIHIRILPTLCQTYITRNRFMSDCCLHHSKLHYTEQIHIRILPTLCQTYISQNRFKSDYFLHRARHTLHGTDSNQDTSYAVIRLSLISNFQRQNYKHLKHKTNSH